MAPLSELKDIHLPETIGLWPPAYGWWVLLLLVLLGAGWGIILWRKKSQVALAQRQALSLLSNIDATEKTWPRELNTLLKRLAMAYFPKHEVANLHGKAWRIFLVSQLPIKKQTQFAEQFSMLQANFYRSSARTQPDFERCVEQVRSWIKHAVPPNKKTQLKEQLPDV